jgi:hypothetical protein
MGSWHQSYEVFIASHRFETPTRQLRLMEAICERNNMKSAIKRVFKNKGAPGVDGKAVRKIKKAKTSGSSLHSSRSALICQQ